MTIRYAQTTDYPWLKENDPHISPDILNQKIERNEIYLVEENNQPTGYLRYNLFWDSIPFMNMLYLPEEHRRKGTGKTLVHHWEQEMKKRGFAHVLTSTLSNEEAQHFYRKIGYKEIGGFTYLNDPLEIIFHKQL